MDHSVNRQIHLAKLSILTTLVLLVVNTSCVHGHHTNEPTKTPPSQNRTATKEHAAITSAVSNDDPIDGSTNYPAIFQGDYQERKIYLVNLPHGTPDTTPISLIQIWVNTTNLEGQRVGTNYTCDEIQIVNDNNPDWTVIRSQDVYRVELEGTSAGEDKVTPEDGFPSAATFLFQKGDDGFDLIEKTVRQGHVYIGIKQHQPPEKRIPNPSVDSAKVEIRS